MKTIRGVYLDLKESEYCYRTYNLEFYFSSKVYLEKFKNLVNNYIKDETQKLRVKYGINNVNFDLLLLISFYKKIEKRGFRVHNTSINKDINLHELSFITLINY